MSRKIIIPVCSLLIVAALVSLWFTLRPARYKVDQEAVDGVQNGLIQVLAAETVKALQGKGKIVIVTMELPGQERNHLTGRWKNFDAELTRSGSLSPTEIVSVKMETSGGQWFWPTGAFPELLVRHADADVMVFLTDLPEWVTVANVIPKSGGPRIVAVDNLGPLTLQHYGGFFHSGILTALIGAPTRPLPEATGRPATPREWFNRHYQIYTPGDYESLPGGTASGPPPAPPGRP